MNSSKDCIIAILLAMTIITGVASATPMPVSLTFVVPFDFYVVDHILPAGTYTVASTNLGSAIQIFDERGKGAFVITNSRNTPKQTRDQLLFHQYGGTSFLAGINWSDSQDGLEIPITHREELIARSGTLQKTVAITQK
jgi:hypothetical protein